MAKRKRLTPAQPDYLEAKKPALETKSMAFSAPRAPIADVAAETSAAAALQELADEMRHARADGRLIQALPEAAIEVGYLVRDRMLADDDELGALMASLAARGQQTPVEVVELGDGRYGLISGWRRVTALRRLLAETGETRFATVQAILRRPEGAAEAYVAMVEENEIRVGLSYYERARVAAKAVEQGVYETEKQALLKLFSTASRAKRSKIRSFLTIYRALDDVLRFPMAIPERLGLALAKAFEADAGRVAALRAQLAEAAPAEAAAELACLQGALAGVKKKQSLNGTLETHTRADESASAAIGPLRGIWMTAGGTAEEPTLTLSGYGLTETFRARLEHWLRTGR